LTYRVISVQIRAMVCNSVQHHPLPLSTELSEITRVTNEVQKWSENRVKLNISEQNDWIRQQNKALKMSALLISYNLS
jgi:hypothetical protein